MAKFYRVSLARWFHEIAAFRPGGYAQTFQKAFILVFWHVPYATRDASSVGVGSLRDQSIRMRPPND